MTNRVIHFEIPVDEAGRASEFYGRVLGWSFSQWGPAEYWTMDDEAPGVGIGAAGALAPREDTPGVLVYVGVDDIDPVLERVTEAGGGIELPRSPIPGMGWMARFRDPEGNLIGLFEEDPAAPVPGDATG